MPRQSSLPLRRRRKLVCDAGHPKLATLTRVIQVGRVKAEEALADVRCGAHCGLKSDTARGPLCAASGLVHRNKVSPIRSPRRCGLGSAVKLGAERGSGRVLRARIHCRPNCERQYAWPSELWGACRELDAGRDLTQLERSSE
jgi:hypothetical protein